MCGSCCKKIYVKHGKNVIDNEELFLNLKEKHPFYKSLKLIGKDNNGLIFECQNLENNKCRIHKKRWKICKKYPDEEMFMMGGCMQENCGYHFEPIYTFDEILNKTKG